MTGGPDLGTHGRRNPTPWNKGGATARENSPYRSHIAPLAGQNSPCARKMAQFGRFYPSRANFIPLSPATSPARATFLPHQPQHHHGLDRNDAPTRHTKRRNETFSAPAPHTPPQHETFIAPARHKRPKIAHFPHAGANFLSQHTTRTHAWAIFLSTTQGKSKRTNSRMQFPSGPSRHNLIIHKIPAIRLHTMKHT